MFGLQKYITKLNEIEWYFPIDMKETVEEILMVEFEANEDYFTLTKVLYTYFDILEGLEEMDFTLKKIGDIIQITINNI